MSDSSDEVVAPAASAVTLDVIGTDDPVTGLGPLADQVRHEQHRLDLDKVKAERRRLADQLKQSADELMRLRAAEDRRWATAMRIFAATAAWLASILVLLLLRGWGVFGFHLGDAVPIALLTTTTATVFGVTFIVARFLFPSGGS